MTNILELGRSILTSVLQEDLEFTWVLKMGNIVDFAINHNPARFLSVVMEDLIKLREDLHLLFRASLLCHYYNNLTNKFTFF